MEVYQLLNWWCFITSFVSILCVLLLSFDFNFFWFVWSTLANWEKVKELYSTCICYFFSQWVLFFPFVEHFIQLGSFSVLCVDFHAFIRSFVMLWRFLDTNGYVNYAIMQNTWWNLLLSLANFSSFNMIPHILHYIFLIVIVISLYKNYFILLQIWGAFIFREYLVCFTTS